MSSNADPVVFEAGLVDTNVLIHWAHIDPLALPENVAVSAVTIAELAAGVQAAEDGAERARRLDVLQRAEGGFDPLPFDVFAARAYGRIAAAARLSGRSPRARVADQMIAAVAAAQGLPLFTTNVKDFSHLAGIVKVVGVPRPSGNS